MGTTFTFVDLGRPLGPWALRLQPVDMSDWNAQSSFVLDALHPMSRLVSSIEEPIPKWIRYLASTEFENADLWNHVKFMEVQDQLMAELRSQNLVSQRNLPEIHAGISSQLHGCPYGPDARGRNLRI